ncbi:hypothetical protein [Glycomyces tarimensis]
MRLTATVRVLLGLTALATAGAVGAAPAAAHPLGDPQTVRLTADGSRVKALWTAPPDDLVVLGSVTGAIPDQREYVFDLGADAEPAPVGETDAELLTGSRAVADYLAEHIRVGQDGRECPAEVDLAALVDEGAELVFACPEPVTAVEVEVTMLTDADPAYRTVAFADGAAPEQHLYTVGDPVAEWRFDATAAEEGRDWFAPVALAVAIAASAAAAVVVLRRLRRTAAGSPS